jgi:hypothetical protein
MDAKICLSPSSRITLAEKRTLRVPISFSNEELLPLVISELSKELVWFSPRFLDFPNTRCNWSGPNIEIHLDVQDVLRTVTDRMKECREEELKTAVQSAADLETSKVMQEHADLNHLLCFSEVLTPYVRSEFLDNTSDSLKVFYIKLRANDLELRKQVQDRGSSTGVTADHILEWSRLFRVRNRRAHPHVSKAQFMAAVKALIEEQKLTVSTIEVFEKIFDAFSANQQIRKNNKKA